MIGIKSCTSNILCVPNYSQITVVNEAERYQRSSGIIVLYGHVPVVQLAFPGRYGGEGNPSYVILDFPWK